MSQERLIKLEKELADAQLIRAHCDVEKSAIALLRKVKEEIEKLWLATEQAERQYDLNRAAELSYGRLAQLESDFADEEGHLQEGK